MRCNISTMMEADTCYEKATEMEITGYEKLGKRKSIGGSRKLHHKILNGQLREWGCGIVTY